MFWQPRTHQISPKAPPPVYKSASNLGVAPAKVNLYLHVTGRRADGYHLLDSLAVFANAADIVAAAPAQALTLALHGNFGTALAVEPDNLVLRAARALADLAGIEPRAAISLEKTLPVASGIGGGSADAAAALRVLGRLWNVNVAARELAPIAAALGADVPVCLASMPRRMSGIGEILRPGPALPPFGLALVNPGLGVPTPSVFKARAGEFSSAPLLPAGWDDAASMAASLAALRNDLEPPAIALCPAIGDVLAALRARGCLLARMSGSGATCFALFPTEAEAKAAAASCARPGWWCWGGTSFAAGGFTEYGPAP